MCALEAHPAIPEILESRARHVPVFLMLVQLMVEKEKVYVGGRCIKKRIIPTY